MSDLSEYTDSRGRMFKVELLDDGDDPSRGAIVGPPFLDDLGLPDELMVRLHNELYHRGIYTERQANANKQDVASALMSALKLDVGRILEAYRGGE